ncbi:hypothetical protein JG688_00005549 [Phytophthora aleatoria]|uniref:Uncharacterized protein n=1 Tax=Phytophthora aleatoria TaxID=2496075 RepID=A0A8J5IZM3_9STRA|nr:hypothetical protein JG688_00005549 [Phytophthora aleatoria]
MRNLGENDVDVDGIPEERELYAASVMRRLLLHFAPLTAIVAALQWKRNYRVIRAQDAPHVLLLI